MGSGSWSRSAYASYAADNITCDASTTFTNASAAYVNTLNSLNVSARTKNVVDKYKMSAGVRECRDSEEHPNTTPIIVAFDVTGSMGRIPHKMVSDLLPKLMGRLKEIGVPDPELMFMGIGDYHYDDAPIQVTQFESDTDKICDSLTSLYLEGGGGGDREESYLMAWIVAGYHTETDSWYNRHKKGFLFTIGDEGNHKNITEKALVEFMGYEKGCGEITAVEALEKAREQYNVFHIHVNDGYNRFREDWHELLGDNVIRCESNDLNKVIADTIHKFIENPVEAENKEYKY